jgi:hypothetical protein
VYLRLAPEQYGPEKQASYLKSRCKSIKAHSFLKRAPVFDIDQAQVSPKSLRYEVGWTITVSLLWSFYLVHLKPPATSTE